MKIPEVTPQDQASTSTNTDRIQDSPHHMIESKNTGFTPSQDRFPEYRIHPITGYIPGIQDSPHHRMSTWLHMTPLQRERQQVRECPQYQALQQEKMLVQDYRLGKTSAKADQDIEKVNAELNALEKTIY